MLQAIIYIIFFFLDSILSFSEGSLKLRCTDTNAQVDLCVAIKHDFTWVLTYCDNIVDGTKCSALCKAPCIVVKELIFILLYYLM